MGEPSLPDQVIESSSRQVSPRRNSTWSPGFRAAPFTFPIVFHGVVGSVPVALSLPSLATK